MDFNFFGRVLIAIKFSKFPFYKLFADQYQEKFNDHYFYVSYIGTPKHENRQHADNLLELPVYIKCVEKNSNKLKEIIKLSIDFGAINLVYIGQYIKNNGLHTELENFLDRATNVIKRGNIEIPLDAPYIVRTMKEFCAETPFQFHLLLDYNQEIEDHLIYTYKDMHGRNIHIPAMESLRHFYMDSMERTLQKYILTPNPLDIGQMYQEFYEIGASNSSQKTYKLILTHFTKKIDGPKIAYFLHNNTYKAMFNKVYDRWARDGIIESPIPSLKTINMKVRTIIRDEAPNDVLVCNIYQSTLLSFDGINVKCTHPNDYARKKQSLERDQSHDSFRKKPQEPNSDNENDDTSNSNPPNTKHAVNPNINAYDLERDIPLYSTKYNMQGLSFHEEKAGQQDDKGGRLIEKDETITPTTSSEIDRKSDGSQIHETKQEETPKAICVETTLANNIQKISESIQKMGYTVYGPKSFLVREADCKKQRKIYQYIKQEPCKKAEAYVPEYDENGQMIGMRQRKYTVFKIILDDYKEDVFCLDIEPKGKPKHMLVLLATCEFEEYINEVLSDVVFEQVKKGNHEWLKDNKLPKYTSNFVRLRHLQTAEKMAENIVQQFDILKL